MNGISLVMIVKNESDKLRRCLKSVRNYVDEIIIADTGSTENDKTVAEEFGCRIFDYKWDDDFSKARNYAIEKASYPWILVLDADEYITAFNRKNVKSFMNGERAVGKIKRTDSFIDDGIEKAAVCYISRFFPKDIRYTGRIHEQVDSNLERKNIGIEIYHDGYLNRSEEKAQRNLRILKAELDENPSPYYQFQIAKEYSFIKDYAKENEYITKAYNTADKNDAYFPLVTVQYLYNLLKLKDYSTALKVIEAERNRFNDYPDFHFVSGLFYLDYVLSDVKKNISYFNMIEASFKRCLEIGENHKYEGVNGAGSFCALHNLGTFYESMGNAQKAKEYYTAAAKYDYKPSIERLNLIK